MFESIVLEKLANLVASAASLAGIVALCLAAISASRPAHTKQRAVELFIYITIIGLLTVNNVPSASSVLAHYGGLVTSWLSAVKSLVFAIMLFRISIFILRWYGMRTAMEKRIQSLTEQLAEKEKEKT